MRKKQGMYLKVIAVVRVRSDGASDQGGGDGNGEQHAYIWRQDCQDLLLARMGEEWNEQKNKWWLHMFLFVDCGSIYWNEAGWEGVRGIKVSLWRYYILDACESSRWQCYVKWAILRSGGRLPGIESYLYHLFTSCVILGQSLKLFEK